MNKIIKYGLIILGENSFLINRKYGTKLFLMPGGKPELNETDYLITKAKELSQLPDQTLKKLGEQGRDKKEQIEKREIEKIRDKFHVK